MSKIPQVIARTFSRRRSFHIRRPQFLSLARYSWLKPIADAIWAERVKLTETESLAHEAVQGKSGARKGTETYERHSPLRRPQQNSYVDLIILSQTDSSLVLRGLEEAHRQPVIIKKYRQSSVLNGVRFQDLVQLSQPDNHPAEDLRIIWPIEAFEDHQHTDYYGYYLVFKAVNEDGYGATLAQWLAAKGAPLTHRQVRRIVEQLLQSLRHLHHHPIRLASDQLQVGMSHGNLSADSVVCVERLGETFFYLSDFAIWSAPLRAENIAYSNSAEAMKQDLKDLGRIGRYLQQHQLEVGQRLNTDSPLLPDEALDAFINRLEKDLTDVDAAWYAWLNLSPLSRDFSDKGAQRETIAPTQSKPSRWPWIAGAMLLALLAAAGGLWWLRSRRMAVAVLPERVSEIQVPPEGEFRYVVVENGRWQKIVAADLFRGQSKSVKGVVGAAHDEFLQTEEEDIPGTGDNDGKVAPEIKTAESIQAAIDRVKASVQGELPTEQHVDFAVVPLVKGLEIPSELGYEIIAYDGLAIVAPFSYEHRRDSAVNRWDGEISLEQVRKIYTSSSESRSSVYAELSATEIFEREILSNKPLTDSSSFNQSYLGISNIQSGGAMIREMLEEFEIDKDNRSRIIGFAPLSSVIKQCSVYPLAVSVPGRAAVSPLVMASREPISPETDLCDDKALYQANFEAFRRDRYPLAYPIVVVFPRDNSRAEAGQKFAEMMRTIEVQQLFLEAGLVPVVDPFELAEKDIIVSEE